MKTHWKKHFNPKYLGAYSLENGEDLVVKIIELIDEEVQGSDGNKEILPVLYLKNQKPFILNKTNATTIAKVVGSDYVEDWPGHKIQIFATSVSAFGTNTMALRVRPVAPKKEKLEGKRFSQMLVAINAGQYKAEDAIANFQLTDSQIKELNEISQ